MKVTVLIVLAFAIAGCGTMNHRRNYEASQYLHDMKRGEPNP